MSLSRKPPIDLHRARRARSSIRDTGPVKLNESAQDHETVETKMADKLVIACRENVRFLNFHLQPYEKYLELPAMVDNALYLAYTIRIKDNKLFDALSFRKMLNEAGIETSSAFSFIASEKDSSPSIADDECDGHQTMSCLDTQAFCLACHQYLTILDLEHIVDTFEKFFQQFEPDHAASSAEINPGDGR